MENYTDQIECFSATVTNLQSKVEALTTTNALMKEDLSISKNNILSLHYENRQLKKELGIEVPDLNEVRWNLIVEINFVESHEVACIIERNVFSFRMESPR